MDIQPKLQLLSNIFSFLGAPVQAVAASGTPEPLPVTAVTAKDVHDAGKIQMEPGVVGVEEFTGEQAAAIVDEGKSSKISINNFSFGDWWT